MLSYLWDMEKWAHISIDRVRIYERVLIICKNDQKEFPLSKEKDLYKNLQNTICILFF